jgi:uncharacterized protein with HEPN domain
VFSDDERAREWIADIIDYADRIAAYLDGRTFEQFAAETMVRDAVERCLLSITEAAVRLGEARMAAIAPAVPIHALRGLGNILRHDYRGIDARLVWDTATADVPALRDACTSALARD